MLPRDLSKFRLTRLADRECFGPSTASVTGDRGRTGHAG